MATNLCRRSRLRSDRFAFSIADRGAWHGLDDRPKELVTLVEELDTRATSGSSTTATVGAPPSANRLYPS